MNLIELKNLFFKKKINKADYIKKIYNKYHDTLFKYSDLIIKTDIQKIEITSSNVKMTSKKFGVNMILPKHDHRSAPLECINFNSCEENELEVIMEMLPKRGNFIDIGANIGWHSLIIAKKFKKIKVYAFEPIKKTYNSLIQNIKLNSIKNINPYNFGFFNESKKISFYTYKEGSVNSSIQNLSQRSSVILQRAHVKIFDNFIYKNKIKVDFIKCDVEGAELFVFLGARKVLLNDKPIVFCEMLRKWCKKFKYHPNEIILLFKEYGYECFKFSNIIVKKSLNVKVKSINASNQTLNSKKFRLIKISKINNTTKETNFLFIHKVKDSKIIKRYI
jgi:FkbM family methyltransferase